MFVTVVALVSFVVAFLSAAAIVAVVFWGAKADINEDWYLNHAFPSREAEQWRIQGNAIIDTEVDEWTSTE